MYNPSPALTLCFTICLTAICTSDVGADETIEEIVVAGSRLSAADGTLPGKLTVLTRKAIEERNKASVLELLRGVDGLHVTQYGGRGGATSVFLRGAEPNFTVVLIDGVKVNDPNNSRGGSFDFANLNAAEIERIEIVQGPRSSVYGSDALSGVINIITRSAGLPNDANLNIEIGEESYSRASLSASIPAGDRRNLYTTFSTVDDGDGLSGNSFNNRTAALRLRNEGSLNYDISARWAESDAEAFPQDSGGSEFAILRALDKRDNRQLTLSSKFEYQASQRLTVNLLATHLDQQERLVSPGIAPGLLSPVPPNASDAELSRTNLATYAVLDVSPAFVITGGLDHQAERGVQQGSVEIFPGAILPTDFRLDRDTLGVFTELRYIPYANIELSASLRHDDPQDLASETSLRLGAQWKTNNMRWYVDWGEAFKTPSFFALGHGLVGNPDLKPETSEGGSLGVDYQVNDNWRLSLSGFHTEYDNLIDFDFNLFTNVNRKKVEIQGFEISNSFVIGNTASLDAYIAYVDVDAEGTKLRQRPDWRGGANFSWSPRESLMLTASWTYVGATFDSSIPTGGLTIERYDRVDVSANWALSRRLEIQFAVDNVTNESYQESVGFPALGIRSRLGLRLAI